VLVMADAGEDNLLHAIERDEAWLAEVMRAYPAPACRSLDLVKQRVRIEVVEQALPLGAVDVPTEGLADTLAGVKSAVRRELAEMSGESADDARADLEDAISRYEAQVSAYRFGRWARIGAGLAVAALVALWFAPRWLAPPNEPGPVLVENGGAIDAPGVAPDSGAGAPADAATYFEDWQATLAQDSSGTMAEELAEIDAEIDGLADSYLSIGADDWGDDLDALGDDLDGLIGDLDDWEDV
jgi:hypothetical protein